MSAKLNKGLGTGLGALFGNDDFDEEESELLYLPISKVEPRLEQPRNYFNEEALQELAESISQYGLIQPITVRKLDSGYYQIIAGERRWRASRLAGLAEVPVRVIEADDRRTAELALVENLQREDLNPIEEAKGYKTLIEVYGLTQEEAAKSVEACLCHDAYAHLGEIQAPTLVIGGEKDQCLGSEASGEIAAAIPGAQLIMYDQWGHGLYEEAKDFNQVVMGFLSR